MTLDLLALVALAGSGCIRAGFDGAGDGSAGPKDGPVRPDGMVSDGDTPDSQTTDQQASDGGIAGTWIDIAKKTFTMGSAISESCRTDDEVQHKVTLTHGFRIQATEVTQGQFEVLMGYNPSDFSPGGSEAACGSNCPVERVNWHEAAAYCNALSQRVNKTSCFACSGGGTNVTCQPAAAYSGQKIYTCPGYRLPTEAEWELAYRAGTQTPYYNGGNNTSACTSCSSTDANGAAIAWYCANSSWSTHPTGQKPPNSWGLFDMAGSVWEWCHDWYVHDLGAAAVTDPWGPPSGTYRVVRGGSWSDPAHYMRAAARDTTGPTSRTSSLGFRCVTTIN